MDNQQVANYFTAIMEQLRQLAEQSAPVSPNYRRQLGEYAAFDWSEIGAVIVEADPEGPAIVEWNLHRFTRRSGAGKFGPAIWFSRPIGGKGEESYARLITFKDFYQAEALPAGLGVKPLRGPIAAIAPAATPPPTPATQAPDTDGRRGKYVARIHELEQKLLDAGAEVDPVALADKDLDNLVSLGRELRRRLESLTENDVRY